MLALLMPALINYLIDSEFTKYDTNISKSRSKLHEFSLQYLLKIGPVYPQVCKPLKILNNNVLISYCHFRNLK